MTKINSQSSGLGTVTIFGPRNPNTGHTDEPLWVLTGYTPRVQQSSTHTPGSHGLRVLAVRNEPREMKFAFSGNTTASAQFADPMLLDLWLQQQGKDKEKFAVEISGVKVNAWLKEDTRVAVSPVWEHPDSGSSITDINAANYVPAYFLQTGVIPLDTSTLTASILPGFDKTQPVFLTTDGVIYHGKVPAPGGGEPISTRLHLLYQGNDLCLMVDDTHPDPAWGAVWQRVNEIADSSRVAHWGSIAITPQPQLYWRVKLQGKALVVDWPEAIMPKGAVIVTLADRKPEDRKLPPMSVMRLTCDTSIQYTGSQLTLTSVPATISNPLATWHWDSSGEAMRFGSIPLVHDAESVRERLFNQYGEKGADDKTTVGFLLLEDGWAEIPFTADERNLPVKNRTLPGIVLPENLPDASGSFWLGNRRREIFNSNVKAELSAPWSILLDEPGRYAFKFIFNLQSPASATLQSATVELADFAMTLRGGIWLAATRPDGHDALPCVSDDPDAFFDLLLRRCEGSEGKSPFVLDPLTVWVDKPTVMNMTVNPDVTAAQGSRWRIWLRHPTQPGIQVLPVTRSDTGSTGPHVSRALTAFDAKGGTLKLEDMLSMMPRLSKQTRGTAVPASPIMPLVALMLPGLEFCAKSTDSYDVKGYYTLPLWDEPHACAVLPLPENATKTPPPVITALMPEALKSSIEARLLLRDNAATLHSVMFTNDEVAAKNLYPFYDWKAKVSFSDQLTVKGNAVTWGEVTINDVNWVWTASGNELLEGPTDGLELNNDRVCIIKSNKQDLVGWSVAELESSPGMIRDGRGVSWGQKPDTTNNPIARLVQIQSPPETLWLFSTQSPLSISGANGIQWRFSFTDVPVSAQYNNIAPSDGTVQKQGWTWSLFDPLALGNAINLIPLPLGPNLRFMPTALTSLSRNASGFVARAIIEGTLSIGEHSSPDSTDTLHRVAINLTESGANTLKISSITPVSGGTISWDLMDESQLTGSLTLKNGILWLENPQLVTRVLSVEKKLPLDIIDTTAPEAISLVTDGLQASISLQTAGLMWVRLTTVLRDGVSLSVNLSGEEPAKLTWFGNLISCDARIIDATRRICVLEPARVDNLSIISGLPAATLVKGVMAISFNETDLGLQTYFFELVFDLVSESTTLRVTHLLHSEEKGPGVDLLRLDGNLKQVSQITWPALEIVEDGFAGDSQVIDFANRQTVTHQATFLLADHCLQGNQFRSTAGKGIGLSAEAATWLVDTQHRFTCGAITRSLRCLGVLQPRRPSALAEELDVQWSKNTDPRGFGFVPGYIGMKTDKHTDQFLRPGVRRLSHGYAGLLDRQVVQALRLEKNDDAWLMLGGMTVLYRQTEDMYGLLHLPFIATSDNSNELGRVLRVNGPQTTLDMVRHDLLTASLRLTDSPIQSPADLIQQPLKRAVPFSGDLGQPVMAGGTELAGNWFSDESPSLIPGWHVEQLQRPGTTPLSGAEPPALPFVFPRASLMLAALLIAKEPTDYLSLLTCSRRRQGNSAGTQPMTVRRALIRLPPVVDSIPLPTEAEVATDLIVGGPGGVIAVPLTRADAAIDDVKHFISLATARMAEPTFIIHRNNEGYLNYSLPALDRDPLEFPVRALSRVSGNPPDGRLTWPVPGEVDKMAAAHVSPRRPQRLAQPVAMSCISGEIQPGLSSGKSFLLTTSVHGTEKTDTVWLQEWEQVAFDNMQQRFAPWARDASAAARPMVPSANEIAHALLQMDPTLSATSRVQTWLPPATITLDFATRTGAFVAMGVRSLRSVNSIHTQYEPAVASLSTLRSMRRPRPAALPQNSGKSALWRRTVAWYGNQYSTCMALAGGWDMMTAPLVNEIPEWALLIGQPVPSGLTSDSAGGKIVWCGSLKVKCLFLDDKNQPQARPAEWVLGMMHQATSLRCGLRMGTEWIDFSAVEVVAGDTLLFTVDRREAIEEGNCAFECRMIPPANRNNETAKLFLAPPSTEKNRLESAALRTLLLTVQAPVEERYPLPLRRRTIFFSDPALDQVLSKIDPISASSGGAGGFNVWLDKATITPGAMLVIRVKSDHQPVKSGYTLNAWVVRHRDGKQETLTFTLPGGTKPIESVLLDAGDFYTLPTSLFNAALQPEDKLVLNVQRDGGSALLVVAVKANAAQTPPPAMYSLVVTDPEHKKAWCAAHSPSPAPESVWVEVLDSHQDKLLRRGVFRWVSYTSATSPPFAWSILKSERETESTFIPAILEYELVAK